MGVMYAPGSKLACARVGSRGGEWAGSMTLWLVFALMTAAAIFAVLLPLAKLGQVPSGTELAVYRDQLDEIARDRAAELIGEAEAEAARIEVSRRLLAAADTDKAPVTQSIWRRRATALAALLILPAGAAALYLALGSPQLPGEPLAGRIQEAHNGRSIAQMIAQIEAHLEQNPNDARGWQVIAPVYMKLGRFDQAVIAQRKLIQLQGENADRDADLGEYLKHIPVVQGDGANAGEFFPIIHTLFSNIKAWLVGTHHGVSAKHLPRYLREWSYRFNRRNLPGGLDGYLIRRAVECATITYDQLKTGTMPDGANRIRRPPAAVAQPALAG